MPPAPGRRKEALAVAVLALLPEAVVADGLQGGWPPRSACTAPDLTTASQCGCRTVRSAAQGRGGASPNWLMVELLPISHFFDQPVVSQRRAKHSEFEVG